MRRRRVRGNSPDCKLNMPASGVRDCQTSWLDLSDSESLHPLHNKPMPSATRDPTRCTWPLAGHALYIEYHDKEWGVPAWDDRTQFEFLILEGAQAGLSWSTILNTREGYRAAFAGFDPERIARFGKR